MRKIQDGLGFEAWRQLVLRYGTGTAQTTLGRLQQVLAFEFGKDIQSVEARLEEFELLVSKYDQDADQALAGEIKLATLLKGVPEPLKSHLE